MKPGLLYGIIFFVVFLLVTAGMFFIADSNPSLLLLGANKAKLESSGDGMDELGVGADGESVPTKSKRLKLLVIKPKGEGYTEIDTIKGVINKTRVEVRYDTVYTQKLVKDPSVVDSLNKKIRQIKSLVRLNKQKNLEIKTLKKKIITSKDSTYQAWVRATVKLYQAMAPSEAAKLIQKLSDSESRDLIYKMKNKKAAAILAKLNTELVVKLTKAK